MLLPLMFGAKLKLRNENRTDAKKESKIERECKRERECESENITNTFAHMIAAVAVEEELRHRGHAVADVG